MNRNGRRENGFTFLELLTAVAIIAILGALAVVGYQEYTTRAAAADLVSAHHTIRTAVLAQGDKYVGNCADLARGYDRKALADPYAALDYGFEAVAGGYRPVLTVCATAGGPGNVAVVKRAYESFHAMGVAEKSPTSNETLASFSVRLTDGDKALCKTAPASRGGCGQPPAPAGQATGPVPAQGQPAHAANAGAPAQPQAGSQTVAAAQPTCPAGQQMMTHLVNGAWQRACQPTCAGGQKLNPATHQCDVDHGGAPPATTPAALAQLPAQVRQQVQAAEQQLAQSLAAVTTLDDAISKTMAAVQGLPPEALTQSIPGNSAVGKSVQVNCKLPEFPDGACKDQVMGNFCATLPAGASGNCPVAIMCPKSLGVCQGVTPEMRRIFDQSMQRIAGDWFAQHPGCTRFGQTGC